MASGNQGWSFFNTPAHESKKKKFDWADWIRNKRYEQIHLDTVEKGKMEWQFKATENRNSCWVYLSLMGRDHYCSCIERKYGEFSMTPRSGFMCRHILAAAYQNSLETTLIHSLGRTTWIPG